jgi:hypothetical protein
MTTKPAKLPPGPYRFEPGETADTYRIFAAGDDKPMVEMIYIGGEEDFAAAALGLAQLFAASSSLLASAQLAQEQIDLLLDSDEARIDSVTGDCLAATAGALTDSISAATGKEAA